MCGIVGYVGTRSASELIVEGLKRLEYRGYDSAGLAAEIALPSTERGLQLRLGNSLGQNQKLIEQCVRHVTEGTCQSRVLLAVIP